MIDWGMVGARTRVGTRVGTGVRSVVGTRVKTGVMAGMGTGVLAWGGGCFKSNGGRGKFI